MTAAWYRAVLDRLPSHGHLLDVGIGTGGALLAHADLLTSRDLRVTGVDVDAAYVARCRRAVADRGLADRVVACLESIDDHRGGPYDAAYFSGSFMLLPDPVAALRHVCALLAPGGQLYFTHTVEQRRSRAVEALKPVLRLVTTIDFGRVTYEDDFRRTLAAGGIALDAYEVLRAGRRRAAILAVGRCEPSADDAAPSDGREPAPGGARAPTTRGMPTTFSASADLILRRAALAEVLALRHAVLRPGLPLATAQFDGDHDPRTCHFAAVLDGAVVGCVSAMRQPHGEEDAWQVRGMATHAELAGRGIGRALLAFATAALREQPGPRVLWCNARVTALRFWERAGWRAVSDVFEIPGVGPHRVLRRVL